MANYATLKAAIQQVIKTNGNEEITGALLQQSLLAMVNSLGSGFQFIGVANTSTDPGTPDQNVFYIAGSGTYPNFNNAIVAAGYMGVFKYNGSWTIETLQVGKNYDDEIRQLAIKIGKVVIPFVAGKYYNISNAVGQQVPAMSSNAGWDCARYPVTPGSTAYINGVGDGGPRLWALVDSNGIVTAVADYSDNYQSIVMVIPDGTAELIINTSDTTNPCYYCDKDTVEERLYILENKVDDLDYKVNGGYGYDPIVGDWILDKYYGGQNNPVDLSPGTLAGCRCIRVTGLAGKTLRIYCGATNIYTPAFIATDANRNQLSISYNNTEHRDTPWEITVPANAVLVYFNLPSYVDGDRVEVYGLRESYDTKIANIETSIKQSRTINGKNIVVFGDSINETTDTLLGHTWLQFASESSGANFINCAIGGTQIRQRRELITLFNASASYQVGDWVYYKPGATMNCYKCINAHSGAWDGNDFEEVAYNYFVYASLDLINIFRSVCNTDIPNYENRFADQEAAAECVHDHFGSSTVVGKVDNIKGLDWSAIDAVVIMSGTNDFTELAPGTSGSTNINKTLGAINELCRLFCSTYKHIPVFYNGILVRWFGYSGGTGTPEKWGDVYVPTGGTQTLKQFAESCMDEFINNHIPVLDLYNTLGWNKYNFSQFFPANDGTHPRGGVEFLSMKIVGFLLQNKTF